MNFKEIEVALTGIEESLTLLSNAELDKVIAYVDNLSCEAQNEEDTRSDK
jgi:hypothetical protein